MHSQLTWAARFLQALFANGARHIYLSPGSRSTPLTLAAALHPNFKKTVILDERSAAFAALGAAKQSGTPTVLICTSGTAAANYFPAIVEAKEAGVPFIVLTADRPPNLRQIGSSQTIDQVKLYGNYAVFFHEAGEPHESPADGRRLAYLARQAYQKAVARGGAVHINFPFRKPLEPTGAQAKNVLHFYESCKTGAADEYSQNISRAIRLPDPISQKLAEAQKPLIIAGPCNPCHSLSDLGTRFSELLSAPIIAEPGSWYPNHPNRVYRFEQILRHLPANQMPDLIIRTGDQPFTKSVIDLLSAVQHLPVYHFTARPADQDHAMNVSRQFLLDPSDEVTLPEIKRKKNHWQDTWKLSEKKAEQVLVQTLEKTPRLTDGHATRYFTENAAGFPQVISNSFTPRDTALFGAGFGCNHLNRGAAGIDGILSTTAGVASVSSKKVFCLIGDLAFLHDSNALFTIKNSPVPVITMVVNNSGGAIFKMLPVYKKLNQIISDDLFTTYFETPQETSIQKLAEASGLGYQKASTLKELYGLNLRDVDKSAVIECVTDSEKSMEIRQKLWEG